MDRGTGGTSSSSGLSFPSTARSDGPATGSTIRREPSFRKIASCPGNSRSRGTLEALERGERYVPTDARRKINTAEFLIGVLARPDDALNKLAEAEPFLQSFGDKTSWHNARRIAALAVGREEDAIECMRALASPERLPIMRTYTSLDYQVDLGLVSRLVEKQLAQAQCIAYLEVAEAIGSGSNEAHEKTALNTVRDLLRKARAGA